MGCRTLYQSICIYLTLFLFSVLLIRKNSDTDIKLTDFGLATIVGNEGIYIICTVILMLCCFVNRCCSRIENILRDTVSRLSYYIPLLI